MQPKHIICAVFALIITGFNFAFGQQIYLSPEGDDSNPGTIDKPLATLTAARDKVREYRKNSQMPIPSEIIALAGEYFMFQPLQLSDEDSGTSDFPLTIKAEEGKKVIFRGGVPLTGAEKVNDELWRIFVPQVAWYDSYFDQLYVNDRRAVRARTPNKGFYNVKDVTESVLIRGTGLLPLLAIQEIELDSDGASCVRAFTADDYLDAVITFYHKWDNTMKHIAGFDDSTKSIRTVGTGMQPWNTIDSQSRYYIDNTRSALDSPGEWFLGRSGYLYYIPIKGETIEKTSFFAPVLKEFVVIRGDSTTGKRVENINFENISFEVSGYQLPPQGNEAMQAASTIAASVTLDFAENISFQNCRGSPYW